MEPVAALHRLRYPVFAGVLFVLLAACNVAVPDNDDDPAPCPAGHVHAFVGNLPESRQVHCVRVDADGNHFPDGVGPRYVRYVFTTGATRDAMLEHLENVGHDLTAAQIPDNAPAPWSVYCVGGACTFEPGRGW